MAHDPYAAYLDALSDEMDQSLMALQTARKVLTEFQRAHRAMRKAASNPGAQRVSAVGPTSLRFAGVTVAEAAATLGVGEEHVRRLLRRGELVGVPLGGRVGWRLDSNYVSRVAAQWQAQRMRQTAARDARPVAAPGQPARARKGARPQRADRGR